MRHCSLDIYFVPVGKGYRSYRCITLLKERTRSGGSYAQLKVISEKAGEVSTEKTSSREYLVQWMRKVCRLSVDAIMVRKETRNGLMKRQVEAYFKRVEDHIQFDRVLTAD